MLRASTTRRPHRQRLPVPRLRLLVPRLRLLASLVVLFALVECLGCPGLHTAAAECPDGGACCSDQQPDDHDHDSSEPVHEHVHEPLQQCAHCSGHVVLASTATRVVTRTTVSHALPAQPPTAASLARSCLVTRVVTPVANLRGEPARMTVLLI